MGTRYLAKCGACKCVSTGLLEGNVTDARPYDVVPLGVVHYSPRTGSLCLVCRKCGGRVRAKPVRGTYKASVVCNAKCVGSTGCVCECSCGGKNHGGANA